VLALAVLISVHCLGSATISDEKLPKETPISNTLYSGDQLGVVAFTRKYCTKARPYHANEYTKIYVFCDSVIFMPQSVRYSTRPQRVSETELLELLSTQFSLRLSGTYEFRLDYSTFTIVRKCF